MTDQTKRTLLLAGLGAGAFLAARALWRSRRPYSFRGKTVLITGGSRGLGLVLAREFAQEGANLAVCARDENELHHAADDLITRGARVLPVACDVSDRGQVEDLVRTVTDRFGRIDVLVNNAGIIAVGPMETMTQDDYEQAMRVNFWPAVYTALAVLPQMRERGEGRIVNISSIGGKVAVPHLLPYDASKFALTGLSEGMRAELAREGVVVTTVCPGLMRTGSPPNADFKGRHRQEYAWFAVSGALPLFSISAERAAREIVAACARGDAEAILGLPAQVAARAHGLFPGLTADVLGLVNRLLPAPGGIGTDSAKGIESGSGVAPSFLTAPSDRASVRNNELPIG
jgi:NAD(P)-dependent dehydrogenase (short-subunit alcohol dehydrogenase family)